MDTTYKESVIGQIRGNTRLEWDTAEEMARIVKKMSESAIKNLATQAGKGKQRFFYSESTEELSKSILDNLTIGQKKSLQSRANRFAREGKELNGFLNNFETTYTRGGHRYENGVRVY